MRRMKTIILLGLGTAVCSLLGNATAPGAQEGTDEGTGAAVDGASWTLVSLTFTRGERSRDSSSETIRAALAGRSVEVALSRTGRPAPGQPRSAEASFELTDDEADQLAQRIAEYDWATLSEINSMNDHGFYQSGQVILVRGDETATVEVAGMTNRLDGGGGNISATGALGAIEQLAQALTRMTRSRLD